ncbi:hypothetical protein ACFQZS_12350 [Mucilaginibacter calamicampi]|uniref:MG2 domain-containing protein n=1 Tax=Mucilaginibacter calamicampi TaxID=1302352 RepID=A0ABW2YWS7_9SPHI
MSKHIGRYIFVFVLSVAFLCKATYGQQVLPSKLKTYTDALTAIRELKPIEKLYLQTDKPYYSEGDTLRFKGYLLNADYFTPSATSGLLYVELDNELGKNVKRIMVPVESGLTWGDIALDSADIPNGTYTLRAYTNWMRNFDEDYIFKKNIVVSKTAGNPLLVNANFKQTGSKVEAQLVFSLLEGSIQAFKDVDLKVVSGKRNLSKDKVVTGADGSAIVNFTPPEGTAALSIQATTAGSSLLSIPVNINRKENTDVQFMPEGGALVAGLAAKVGFKAVGEDGKGVAVTGNVLDSKGNKVAAFASAYAGMGSFTFTPTAGEVYSATIDGIAKTYILPTVKPGGTSLLVNTTNTDSLQLLITATADIKGPYYLIAHARGVVCYAQSVYNFPVNKKIAKSLFPSGIIRFSLISPANLPVNERIVFINHHDELRVSAIPHQASYGIRDSIALAIKVTDKYGAPITGSFSVAVTDNDQVKPDSLGSNILTSLLLTSDLKGNIEDPGYYFTGNNVDNLDNLMLTQGWVGYNWEEAFQPKLPFAFKPEKEFVVAGRVTNAFGKPIEKSNVLLLSGHPVIIRDTLTDNTGRFAFKGLFPVDTAIFKLQARNKKGKEFNVGIEMDLIKLPTFAPAQMISPWYLNSDSIVLNNSRTRTAGSKALSEYKGEGTVLNEANIKAKKSVKESKNLNGAGEADEIIDEEELKKADKMTLAELLQQRFPGFGVTAFTPPRREYPESFQRAQNIARDLALIPDQRERDLITSLILKNQHKPWRQSYTLRNQEVHFIIDGIDLDRFYPDEMMEKPLDTKRYNYIKTYLDYFTTEDITGIELMVNPKYTNAYNSAFELDRERMGRFGAFAYFEITTRAKKGPFLEITPGTYLHKTLPFTLPKQFYSPKYTVKNKTAGLGTDLRSTIFWEPNIITDKEGKASLSFYSADKAANYTVIVEGTNLDGALGFGKQQIKIK